MTTRHKGEELENEIWRPISGFDDLYEISDWGRVRSLRYDPPRLLFPKKASGYPSVVLCRGPQHRRRESVHVLVLEAFTSPRPAGHEAGHMNHVRDDNRLTNLAWITRQENNDQMTRAGRRRYNFWRRGGIERVRGENHPGAKLTTGLIRQAKTLHAEGFSFRAIVAILGLCVYPSTVRRAGRGLTWRVAS